MKTFLNVLYRRILYKIPLKLLLILLVLFGLLFLGFSKAEDVEDLIVYNGTFSNVNIPQYTYTTVVKFNGTHEIKSCCVKFTNYNHQVLEIGFSMTNNGTPSRKFNYSNNGVYVCLDYYADGYLIAYGGSSMQLDGDIFVLNDLLTTPVPKLTSLQCQTEYNLIPINSVDTNYCITNNLCPSQDIPVGTGNLTQLYINNILHVGAPTILMDIPEEIDWDYEYTMGGNIMNIDIVGYNVDYDKINEQINLQNFKPSSEDLSQVVSGIIPLFVPGLCIILLLYFIFRFIKKIF